MDIDLTLLIDLLRQKITQTKGLKSFLLYRRRFEGWLKVELCNLLVNKFNFRPELIIPENENIDIVIKLEKHNIAIELKVVVTNYSDNNIKNDSSQNITQEISSIIKDIHSLKNSSYSTKKLVVFIAYPLSENNRNWNIHKEKIKDEVEKLNETIFEYDSIKIGIYYTIF